MDNIISNLNSKLNKIFIIEYFADLSIRSLPFFNGIMFTGRNNKSKYFELGEVPIKELNELYELYDLDDNLYIAHTIFDDNIWY